MWVHNNPSALEKLAAIFAGWPQDVHPEGRRSSNIKTDEISWFAQWSNYGVTDAGMLISE